MTTTHNFERECDQKLFEVLSNTSTSTSDDDLKNARRLIAEGTNINTRSSALDIPCGFLLP